MLMISMLIMMTGITCIIHNQKGCDRAQTANNDGETTLIAMHCFMIDVWLFNVWNVSSCEMCFHEQ